MPPRFFSLTIVVFWLATTSWLVQKEIWPNVEPNTAPPFHIDLADEAFRTPPIRWAIYRSQATVAKRIGRAKTWVEYREQDDTFEFHNEVKELQLANTLVLSLKVPQMNSMYRVTPDGDLRELAADVKVTVSGLDLYATISGPVRDRRFTPKCTIEAPGWGRQDVPVEPVEVSGHGSVLNPMHPINRLSKLRPGQRWQLPLIDPMFDAVAAMARKLAEGLPVPTSTGPRLLSAEVLSEPQLLTWNNEEVSCLVIEYRDGDDDLVAKTWVRRNDGLVLQQEAGKDGQALILLRE